LSSGAAGMTSPSPHLPPPPAPLLNGAGRHTPALRSPPVPRDDRPQALAALLSAAYADIDALRHELRGALRRTDRAERALAALQPSPGGSPASAEKRKRALADEQARADAAERERDDLRDRLRQVCDAWDDHARFAASCESRFADARAGFARTLHDVAGPSTTTLPPLPQVVHVPSR
jgi:ABC-type transporter Mla subunit MlaD